MADSAQERTEQATQRRLEQAAEQGQVAYSKELTAALLLLLVLAALRFGGGALAGGLEGSLRACLSLEMWPSVARDGIQPLLERQQESALAMILPLLLLVLAVVALSGFLQIGFSINLKRLELRWSRLDPANGVKKLFSSRSVMTTLLGVLKLIVVGLVAWTTIDGLVPKAARLADAPTQMLLLLLIEGVFDLGFKVGGLVLVLAVGDLLWQRWRHGRDLMMTKEEVKEERKQSEGDPRAKSKIRQIQRDLARARMMRDVKKATVVVRNPTHYAVALRYQAGKDPAPRVMAKGRNLIALRILELAEKAGVPVRVDPPLARQLYATVKVGRTIPEELFQAVAKVLAWVYKRRKARAA